MKDSIYEYDFVDNAGASRSLGEYRDKVLLIVNTASQCGFTPQYKGLEEIHRSFADRGLVVLGFPCDQFGHQEPGSDEEIREFCERNYGVTFALSTKVEVNGPGTHPVFEYLKNNSNGILGDAIKWNFTKFLVGRDGKSVSRYAPNTEPAQLKDDIETLLGETG